MNARCFPRAASWASGAALYAFALAENATMAFVIPLLFDLMPHAPRLAWLGLLLVWIAPIAVVAVGHRFMHAVLDAGDADGAATAASSLWAGFVAWAAMTVVSITTSLILFFLDPPPFEPDFARAVLAPLTFASSGTARTCIWIVLATLVYELERRGRESKTLEG